MTIHSVYVSNWEPPGQPWWDKVAATPEAPMIEATIKMTLSHREYEELLSQNKPLPLEAPKE